MGGFPEGHHQLSSAKDSDDRNLPASTGSGSLPIRQRTSLNVSFCDRKKQKRCCHLRVVPRSESGAWSPPEAAGEDCLAAAWLDPRPSALQAATHEGRFRATLLPSCPCLGIGSAQSDQMNREHYLRPEMMPASITALVFLKAATLMGLLVCSTSGTPLLGCFPSGPDQSQCSASQPSSGSSPPAGSMGSSPSAGSTPPTDSSPLPADSSPPTDFSPPTDSSCSSPRTCQK